MECIEIISLETVTGVSEEFYKRLLASVKEKYKDRQLKDINLYQHGTIETDFSIHLRWDLGRVDLMGTEAAQYLVQLLKEYGLVSHSVWVEKVSL